jgi:DNA end-binding protein Ku
MPRSIWSGAISFGLVTVPVKLYSAVSSKTVRFHQLHAADGVRIQQKRICPADGEEVSYDDIVKGYEIAPDRYVVITPEELASIEPEKTRTIDIEDFVELSEIDPIYYDHPYYLVPGPGGAKPYRLLLEAMRESEKVAIAKVVLRSKEQLVAIRPTGDVLSMATMNFADEIVSTDGLDELPDAEVAANDRELQIAQQLVESLAAPFEPEKYRDTYRDAVLEMIERKAQGEEVTVAPAPEEKPTAAPDLMSALQASLEAVRGRSGGDGAGKRRRSTASSNGDGEAEPKRKAPVKKPRAAAKRSS